MTTTRFDSTPATTASPVPRRRTLVLLAAVFLVAFAVLLLSGQDNESDSSLATITSSYDQSHALVAWSSYAAMAACAVLVFLGGGIRSALRSRRQPWTADVAMLGFVVIALTIASWVVSGLGMWHAVDQGDDASIRALNYIDTSNFLPLMLGMACAMVGVGTAALAGGSLPRWLAVVSIVLGCLAPLGPLGFVPAMLLPLWALVVAAMVRLEPVHPTT
jgi:Na+/melibiose symporter-like transporter